MEYRGQEFDAQAVFELVIIGGAALLVYGFAITPFLLGFDWFPGGLNRYVGGSLVFAICIGWLWFRGYGEFSSE